MRATAASCQVPGRRRSRDRACVINFLLFEKMIVRMRETFYQRVDREEAEGC